MTWNSKADVARTTPGGSSQADKIREAVKILEENIDENTLFLWTGGKDAQVIADLLLYEVGDEEGVSPVPFGVIDTGNQFDEIYSFRQQFVAANGDQGANTVGHPSGIETVHTKRYDKLLEKVIENEDDPRGYHGEWDDSKDLPEELEGIAKQNASREEWGVPESCGALKTVPMKWFIDDGFENLITGRRADDFIAQSEDGDMELVEEVDSPASHTRINPLRNWSEANVWAYIKKESISYPGLYDEGYRHTDSRCCTKDVDSQVGEYGEGGIDAEKEQVKDELQDMGYV